MSRQVMTLVAVLGTALVAFLAFLRWSEPRLIYFPDRHLAFTPAAAGLPFEDVELAAPDGVRLHGWFVPSNQPSPTVVLFLHGNAGNVSHRLEKLSLLRQLGASTLIVDYRGYGRSEGSPGESGLYLDARAAYEDLVGRRGVEPSRLVLYGESLGTAVAVDLASQVPVGAVILEAVFTSVPDAGRDVYPFLPVRWLVKSRFASIEKIGRVRAPLLVLHSRDDEFFPMRHAERIVLAAGGPARLVELRGGHNTAFLESGVAYRDALREFLDDVRRP